MYFVFQTFNYILQSALRSKHFVGKSANIKDSDHPDWVPSQNMGYDTIKKSSTAVLNRFERAKKRSNICKTESLIMPIENQHYGNTNFTRKPNTSCTSVSKEFHTTDHDYTKYFSKFNKENSDEPDCIVSNTVVSTELQVADNMAEYLLYTVKTENMDEHKSDSKVLYNTLLKRSIQTQTDITMQQMDKDKIAINDLQTKLNNLKNSCKMHSTDSKSFIQKTKTKTNT